MITLPSKSFHKSISLSVLYTYRIVNLACDRLRKILSEPAYHCFYMTDSRGERLIKILVDLMKYENDELRMRSAMLLFDIFVVSLVEQTSTLSMLFIRRRTLFFMMPVCLILKLNLQQKHQILWHFLDLSVIRTQTNACSVWSRGQQVCIAVFYKF